MAIQYTHTFEITYNGELVEGKIGQHEDGSSTYQIDSTVSLELGKTIRDLMKSLHHTDIDISKIEVLVV